MLLKIQSKSELYGKENQYGVIIDTKDLTRDIINMSFIGEIAEPFRDLLLSALLIEQYTCPICKEVRPMDSNIADNGYCGKCREYADDALDKTHAAMGKAITNMVDSVKSRLAKNVE